MGRLFSLCYLSKFSSLEDNILWRSISARQTTYQPYNMKIGTSCSGPLLPLLPGLASTSLSDMVSQNTIYGISLYHRLYTVLYYRKWAVKLCLCMVSDILTSVCEENSNPHSGKDRLKGVRVPLGKPGRTHLLWNTDRMRSDWGSRDGKIYQARGIKNKRKR